MPHPAPRPAPPPPPPCWCIEWYPPENPQGIHTVLQAHPDCPRGCWGEHRDPAAAVEVRHKMRAAQLRAFWEGRPSRGTESWRRIYMERLWADMEARRAA